MWKASDYNKRFRRPVDLMAYAELYGSIVKVVGRDLGRARRKRRVVDLGSGMGMLTRMIATVCDAEVIGFDYSSVAIRMARAAQRKALMLPDEKMAARPTVAKFRLADLSTCEIPEAEIAIATQILEHVDDDRAFAAKMLEAAPIVWASVPRNGKISAMHVRSYRAETIVERFAKVARVKVERHPAYKHWILFRLQRLVA